MVCNSKKEENELSEYSYQNVIEDYSIINSIRPSID